MTTRQLKRLAIYRKCDGHCAYCGQPITLTAMQMDHVHPRNGGGRDDDANLMPSCRPCNNYKLVFSLEEFRGMIGNQIELLRRNATNFRTAERFGLVEVKPRRIVFYFEQPSDSADRPRE